MSQRFRELLRSRWTETGNLLCVGLDPVPSLFPDGVRHNRAGLLEFCRSIVDATASSVCAFKPQIAHFSAIGAEEQLRTLIQHIHDRHPEVPVILDAKRGDIGATVRRYAEEAFVRYDADAVTVNPFMGWESVQGFLEHEGKFVFVLCRTSNPDSKWLQLTGVDEPVFAKIARRVQAEQSENLGLVVGATAPQELQTVRELAPETTLLVPGVGAQGGRIDDVLAARNRSGFGLVVNVSRSVLYASAGEDWAEAAAASARSLAARLSARR
ncbi:MAG: orotidine-5'-phosphate decarboxylase [Pseudomonadales bacterium]|nr:orotidine-5'-phosphate decarboxylase [Pseudomonadales bacterium]